MVGLGVLQALAHIAQQIVIADASTRMHHILLGIAL